MKIDLTKILDDSGFQISDISCLGDQNILCVSSFKGQVLGLKWNGSTFKKVFLTRPFKVAVRKMDVSCSGKYIICSSSDGRLCLLKSSSGKVKVRIEDLFSSKSPIGAFVSLDEEDKLLAIGNDDGDVKIIDLNNLESPVVAEFDNFDDQVSDMLYLLHKKTLICSSGDGSVLVIDTKKNKIISHTESLDDEITCLAAVKAGSKIVCATGMGFLNVFGFNYWGVVQDRLPQHPGTVNCMVSDGFESNILYTGCSDGCVRSLTLHPNTINGVIFHLNDSVEKMQCFETKLDDKDVRLLLSSTCTDGTLYVSDISDPDTLEKNPIKISKKSKIAEVDVEKSIKKTFFADLE